MFYRRHPIAPKYLRGSDCVYESAFCNFSTGDQLKNFTNWQPAFIRYNFPVIGYLAWKGFKQMDWGLLLCHVEPPPTNAELRLYSWNFTTQFVSGQYIADCLLELEISPKDTAALVQAIEQYNPHQEIMLMTHVGKSVEAFWLKNLAISPPECYRQVCDRWDEFMPDTCDHASI
jgi:hypothetical protein